MAQASVPSTVHELEHAAEYLTTATNVSARDRQLAEEVFRLFKSSGQAFHLAKSALGKSSYASFNQTDTLLLSRFACRRRMFDALADSICHFMTRTRTDTTTNTYVIFQSVQALTSGIIRDWHSYKQANSQLIKEVNEYLFHLLCNESRCQYASFVQTQLCRSIALLCKKSLVSLVGNQCPTGFGEALLKRCVDQLKLNANLACSVTHRVENVCRYAGVVQAVLEEIQSPRNCREVACSIKAHLLAKKAFQRLMLPKLFEELLALNHSCARNSNASNSEHRKLFATLLGLLETCFSWDFRLSVSTLPIGAAASGEESFGGAAADGTEYSSTLRPVFAPPFEFGRLLFPGRPPHKRGGGERCEVRKFLFLLYIHLRSDEDAVLAEKVGNCLVQLASLSGDTLFGSNDVEHLTDYIACLTAPEFAPILTHPKTEQEIDMVAGIFSNLLSYTNHSTYEKIEDDDLERFISLLADVTVTFGLQTLHEREDADNIGMSMPFAKAYGDLLTTWLALLTMYNSGLFSVTAEDDLFGSHCFRMLQCFVHMHLAAPFGARTDHEQHYVSEEIQHEIEEADDRRFEDQLQVVGLWAQLCLDKSLPFLDALLRQVMLKFEHGFWSSIQKQAGHGQDLYGLFEDLTWTRMIVSHVVFPAENDDVEEIPSGIIKQCEKFQQRAGSSQSDKTCQYFITQLNYGADRVANSGDAGGVDEFILFAAQMFRLPAMLMQHQQMADARTRALIADALSPEIVKQCLAFTTKWIRVYTLPNDVQVHMLSTTLNAALKSDEACVVAQLEFALNMALFHLRHWSSEPSIAEQCAALMHGVCGKATWDKFNAQFFTESKAVGELFYELSRNTSSSDDGGGVVLALRLNKQALVTLYQALTVAVVSIVNIEDVVEPPLPTAAAGVGLVSCGGWGGGGAVSLVSATKDGGDAADSRVASDLKRHYIEKAQVMWRHLISSVTERFTLALQRRYARDMQWSLIIAALNSSVGIVRAQLQHGTAATCKIFQLAQYIRDSSRHCSTVFDAWCNEHLVATATGGSMHEVNEVLLNFAPLLFEFYTTIGDELSTSITTTVNDAGLQNNLCIDLHALVSKWRFLLVTWIVGDVTKHVSSSVGVRLLEHNETQRAYQESLCACCKALDSTLSNLACLSIGFDSYNSNSNVGGGDRNAAIDSLASHLVACLMAVLDVVTDQSLMLPAVSCALFSLINRYLNALPKRTIFTLIGEHRFDRLVHTMRHGIEVAAGDSAYLLQTYEALANVALEIAFVLGTVRSACAPLSRGFADVKAAAGSNVVETTGMQLDAGQKSVLSMYMSNILEFILTQLFSGQLNAETGGVMANAVYSLICCCRTVAADGGGKYQYQVVFERVLMQVPDEVVRTRLAEHYVAIVDFIEQKVVIRDGGDAAAATAQQQLRVEKKLKLEFRDDIFSSLFTDARMLISVNLLARRGGRQQPK